jgi:hypothetical protein
VRGASGAETLTAFNDRNAAVEVARGAGNCCKPKTSKSPAATAGLLFSKTATRIPQKIRSEYARAV